MDIVFFELDGNSSAKGACKEGIPRAEQMDKEEHMIEMSLQRWNIAVEMVFKTVERG